MFIRTAFIYEKARRDPKHQDLVVFSAERIQRAFVDHDAGTTIFQFVHVTTVSFRTVNIRILGILLSEPFDKIW